MCAFVTIILISHKTKNTVQHPTAALTSSSTVKNNFQSVQIYYSNLCVVKDLIFFRLAKNIEDATCNCQLSFMH